MDKGPWLSGCSGSKFKGRKEASAGLKEVSLDSDMFSHVLVTFLITGTKYPTNSNLRELKKRIAWLMAYVWLMMGMAYQ